MYVTKIDQYILSDCGCLQTNAHVTWLHRQTLFGLFKTVPPLRSFTIDWPEQETHLHITMMQVRIMQATH